MAEVPKFTVEELTSMACSPMPWHRQEAAWEVNTPDVLLLSLAGDKFDFVRRAVACREQAPEEAVRLLAEDKSSLILSGLLQHMKKIPTDVLTDLSKRKDIEVLALLAKRPDLPVELFDKLFTRTSELVLQSLASNRNLPEKYMEAFSRISSNWSPSAIPVAVTLAKNTAVPEKILAGLSKSTYVQIRESVAGNFQTSAEVLEVMSHDHHLGVKKAVAGNRGTSIDVLKALSRHADILKEIVAVNPSFPAEEIPSLCIPAEWKRAKKKVLNRIREEPEYAGFPDEWLEIHFFS